jgi:hypothetical protein
MSDEDTMIEELKGSCCFCNEECNPCSQSCGRCARQMTGWAIGMNTNKFVLKPTLEDLQDENDKLREALAEWDISECVTCMNFIRGDCKLCVLSPASTRVSLNR